jgi:lambda repressor-like predicted transcriptional regulator
MTPAAPHPAARLDEVADILTELALRGVSLTASGADLYLRPRSALNPDLLARVRAHKPQLLALFHAGALASPAECQILFALSRHPGLPLAALPTATRLPSRTLTHALDHLTRRAEITITDAGHLYLRTV